MHPAAHGMKQSKTKLPIKSPCVVGCILPEQDAVVFVGVGQVSNGLPVGFGSAQAFVPVLCIVGGLLPVSHAGG